MSETALLEKMEENLEAMRVEIAGDRAAAVLPEVDSLLDRLSRKFGEDEDSWARFCMIFLGDVVGRFSGHPDTVVTRIDGVADSAEPLARSTVRLSLARRLSAYIEERNRGEKE